MDQVDKVGLSFEKFDRWNQRKFTKYTPPMDFVVKYEDVTEVLKAKQEYKAETYEKYNEWQLDDFFDNNINHNSFNIVLNQPDIKAVSEDTYNATLSITLISGGSGAEIDFKDPWLVLQ